MTLAADVSESWFYASGEADLGPFSFEQMRALYIAGAITAYTKVRRAALGETTALYRSELKSFLRDQAIQPPVRKPARARPKPSWSPPEESTIEAAFTALRRSLQIDGRATRKEYWSFSLLVTVAAFVAGLFDSLVTDAFIGPLSALLLIATLPAAVTVMIRRLHDTGMSGHWLWLILAPLVGFGALYQTVIAPLVANPMRMLDSDMMFVSPTLLLVSSIAPLIAIVVLIWLMSRPSEQGANRFA